MQQVRAVVVDDSAIFRVLVNNTLSQLPGVEVVARCRDGQQALEAIRLYQPDLLSLDVEMPVMDGLQTLREIRKLASMEPAFQRVKVFLLSALTKEGAEATVQGLNEGAMECIPKPAEGDAERNQEVLRQHLQRAVDLVRAQMPAPKSPPTVAPRLAPRPAIANPPAQSALAPKLRAPRQKPQAVVIGVSTGGPAALTAMLPQLSRRVKLPIFIVQHMPAGFTRSLAESLDRHCEHSVVEASDAMLVRKDHIYIAPGGRHMELVDTPSGPKVLLTDAPPENGCRPAADVLFRSIARCYGGKVVAVILTGMGSDGSLGVKPLYDQGAYVVVQDRATSVVWGMPGSAVDAGVVDDIVPLNMVPDAVAFVL